MSTLLARLFLALALAQVILIYVPMPTWTLWMARFVAIEGCLVATLFGLAAVSLGSGQPIVQGLGLLAAIGGNLPAVAMVPVYRAEHQVFSPLARLTGGSAPDVRIVSVSSAAVYGAGHAGPIGESTVISPFSPYGAHKAMMESLCRSYAENFGLHLVIVRLFSVYGAGLEKQLIWDLCCKLAVAGNNQVVLGGTGRELRDWLHVSDAAALLWLARARCDQTCTIVNGATGIATPIREVAEMVCEAWGGEASVKFSGIARKGDPLSLAADCARAIQLGFKPEVTLAEGIREAVGWFKSRQ